MVESFSSSFSSSWTELPRGRITLEAGYKFVRSHLKKGLVIVEHPLHFHLPAGWTELTYHGKDETSGRLETINLTNYTVMVEYSTSSLSSSKWLDKTSNGEDQTFG